MEVKVPKEVSNYQEAVFFGLSLRQLLCSLFAVGVAVGIYFGLRDAVGNSEVGWICVLGAAPFAACGFFTYHGMTAEQFLWAWIKSEILYPKKLVFRSRNLYLETMQEAIDRGEKTYRYGVLPEKQKRVSKKKLKKGVDANH